MAPEQKWKATRGALAAPEKMSSGRPTHVLEQNGASTYSVDTPPISFTDGSFFFDGPDSFFARRVIDRLESIGRVANVPALRLEEY